MARVRARQKDLDATGSTLVVILAEAVEEIAPVARREGWTGPVLGDPQRGSFRAFGLGRLPRRQVYTPKTLAFYLGQLLRGRPPARPGRDVMQQGGDFIVDPGGIVRFAYPGRSSDDRPPVEDLVRCLRSVAPGGQGRA